MIHVVIPAAGSGRRFVEAGYPPKPHVPIDGVPMLRAVVDNLRSQIHLPHRVTVVVSAPPPFLGDDVEVVQLAVATRGAAETILAAGIDEGPLLVANCDQLIRSDWLLRWPADGWLATFWSLKAHHSYVTTDEHGYVEKIAEKQVISNHAVAGIYAVADGRQFADAARTVMGRDEKVLGEFYVSSVLAEMLTRGLSLATFPADVTILGTPEEVDEYHRSRT